MFAAVAVLDADRLEVVELATASARGAVPYEPGLLSFRELPVVARALAALTAPVDLVVCDGQGIAHPRRFGLACHVGVLFDVPSIGCAKSRLVGRHRAPGRRRGCHRRLVHGGDVVGEVVRTQDGVRPVYVSVGHRVSLPTARALVLRLSPRYRLPETTRAADGAVNRLRREALGRD